MPLAVLLATADFVTVFRNQEKILAADLWIGLFSYEGSLGRRTVCLFQLGPRRSRLLDIELESGTETTSLSRECSHFAAAHIISAAHISDKPVTCFVEHR